MMAYLGIAQLVFEKESIDCFVELDPENGTIQVKVPQSNELTKNVLGNKKIFDLKFLLNDFKSELPNGTITCNSIDNLQLTSVNPGSWSVYDSSLVRTFSLDEKNTGITTFGFVTSKYVLSFDYASKSTVRGRSELIFNNHSLKNLYSFKVGRKNIQIGGEKNFLVVASNNNLLMLRNDLEVAISILQGGRTTYRTGFYKNKLELSFRRISDHSKPYGLIYNKEALISEFLKSYILYIDSLNKSDRNKFNLFTSYLLDACNQRVLLENRFINLYVALEVIDNSRTLNANTLKSILNLTKNNCDLIIKVRNKLIHEGKSIITGIEESCNEISIHNSGYTPPFAISPKKGLTGRFFFLQSVSRLHLLTKEDFNE